MADANTAAKTWGPSIHARSQVGATEEEGLSAGEPGAPPTRWAQSRNHLAESLVPFEVETDDVTNTPPTDP